MPLLPGVSLQDQQRRVADEAADYAGSDDAYRKLLVWQPGSGKTLGSLAVANAIKEPYSAVVPAALRTNYKTEEKRFTDRLVPGKVLSYNALVRGTDAEAPTVIFDEAGRIGRPSQQSEAAKQLADKAKHVVLLTGTPIANHPKEFTNIFNILTGQNLTPEDFAQRYIRTHSVRPGGLLGLLRGVPASQEQTLQREEELRNLLAGKIDYYEPASPAIGVKHEDIETEMLPRQAALYAAIYNKLPWILRQKLKYNTGLSNSDLARLRAFMTGPRQIGLSDHTFQRRNSDPYKAFVGSGKLTRAYDELKKVLEANPANKAIIYSNFIGAGLKPYAAALERAKIPHGIFHGAINDVERKRMVDDFNSGKTRVALVGPAGAEGISLRGAQLTQLLDPAWNEARLRQAGARGLRFDSHEGLPEELKNMRVQRFIARLPLGFKDKLLQSVGFDRTAQRYAADDYLRRLSDKKEQLNKQFMEVLKDVGTPKQADDLMWLFGLVKKAAWSYIPRSAVDSVKQYGLYSGKAMLDNPNVLASAAAGRGAAVDEFKKTIQDKLNGWKPESASGPNVLFALPPAGVNLSKNHPLKIHDLIPIKVDIASLVNDIPATRIHGSELMSYDDYKTQKLDDTTRRHRDLNLAELQELYSRSADELWRHYKDDDERGYYAPDVPHAAVITPSGIIPSKYIKFINNLKSAKNTSIYSDGVVTSQHQFGVNATIKEALDQLMPGGSRAGDGSRPTVRIVMPYGAKYLMERLENPKYPHNIGKTRFPGGGVEEGETLHEAAARELEEELGVKVQPTDFKYLGQDHREEWRNQHYVKLDKHGLSPGKFEVRVGGDPYVNLVIGDDSEPHYIGAKLNMLKQPESTLDRLHLAKRKSDAFDYGGKVDVLRAVIKQAPHEWLVDSHQPYTVGITHLPTSYKFHLPRHTISDLLKVS